MGLASRCAKGILMEFRSMAQGDMAREIIVQMRYPVEGASVRRRDGVRPLEELLQPL